VDRNSGSSGDLHAHLSLGNFKQSKALLLAGVSPHTISDGPSAMHHLVSFSNEDQIRELSKLIINAGGTLDDWYGDSDEEDILAGYIVGTPLHWACLQRNIPMVRILCKADTAPEVRNIEKALVIAAALHFADILEILEAWIRSTGNLQQSIDFKSAVSNAAWAGNQSLPRDLRQITQESATAIVSTFDILFRLYQPDAEARRGLLSIAVQSNNVKLIQYFLKVFRSKYNTEQWNKQLEESFLLSVLCGHYEVFEWLLDSGTVSPNIYVIGKKYTTLQTCCLNRQYNPAFMKKLLDMGCHPDELSPEEPYGYCPFAMTVSLGMYDCALLLLEYGADKDFKSGWMGGQTPIVSSSLSIQTTFMSN
jgi:hypothetical protein